MLNLKLIGKAKRDLLFFMMSDEFIDELDNEEIPELEEHKPEIIEYLDAFDYRDIQFVPRPYGYLSQFDGVIDPGREGHMGYYIFYPERVLDITKIRLLKLNR